MMKKLLLCSNNCQEDSNGAAHGDEDNEESDDADVIVESPQEKSHSLKVLRRDVEALENLNFNYSLIVKFVKQGKILLGLLRSDYPVSFPFCPSQNTPLQLSVIFQLGRWSTLK